MFTERKLYRPSPAEILDYACLRDIPFEGISDHAFISRLTGDGMEAAGLLDGDWLVFDPCRIPEEGDIVSLTVYGRPMCRRIFFEPAGDGKPARTGPASDGALG